MSDSREGDTATQPAFRVCMGWSAFEDHESLPEALERAAYFLRIPASCDLTSEVSINRAAEGDETFRPTIFRAERKVLVRR